MGLKARLKNERGYSEELHTGTLGKEASVSPIDCDRRTLEPLTKRNRVQAIMLAWLYLYICIEHRK